VTPCPSEKFGKSPLESIGSSILQLDKRKRKRKLEEQSHMKGLLQSFEKKEASKTLKKRWSSKSTGLEKPRKRVTKIIKHK